VSSRGLDSETAAQAVRRWRWRDDRGVDDQYTEHYAYEEYADAGEIERKTGQWSKVFPSWRGARIHSRRRTRNEWNSDHPRHLPSEASRHVDRRT